VLVREEEEPVLCRYLVDVDNDEENDDKEDDEDNDDDRCRQGYLPCSLFILYTGLS